MKREKMDDFERKMTQKGLAKRHGSATLPISSRVNDIMVSNKVENFVFSHRK